MSDRAAARQERTAPASRPIAAGRRPDDVICLSSIEWDFRWQGHQEIMSTLAAEGHRVLFVENGGSSCKGVIGAESGTYYLERTDHTVNAVKAWLRTYPKATFEEVFEL